MKEVTSTNVSFDNCFKLPNAGLRTYFDGVVRGQPEVYRTPFYGKKTPLDTIAADWDKQLRRIEKEWPTLYEYENDMRSKIGPMSVMKPLKDRMKDIDSYYEGILLPQKPLDERAIRATQSEWRLASRMRIRSQSNTVAIMRKSTNSGSPYFTKRKRVVDLTVPCHCRQVKDQTWMYLSQGHKDVFYHGAAVLGWRGQEGGPKPSDVKQRVVWMFPFAVNVEELQVYQPMIEVFQRLNYVPAWVGMDAVDERITKLFDTKSSNDLVVCTDFSAFDQHFNKSLQDAAFQILRFLFKSDPSIIPWLDNVFPIKYNIPLAYDWNKMRFGAHGMGSGSGGTNADETLAHRCLQHEAAILHKAELNPNSQCLGDDGILSYPGITVEDVVESYTSHGLEMNESKQYASKHDLTYLRRWHHTDYRIRGVCVGVYPTMRALGRLCEQERWYDPEIWSEKMVALRELSILENCKYHPLKEEFLDFCIKGDKFRLGLDIPGFLDNIDDYAREAIDQMPDFIGYTKSLQSESRNRVDTGLSNWWVVNALKSRR